jgi:DNA modification methylase
VPVPDVIPQRYEAHVPLDRLTPHPANPNSGDVGLLSTLLDANGFGGAVLAQESTGLIIDGETRWRTALERGMTGLPVIWVDVDDDARDRLLASWNESTRRGRNDEAKLVALLTGLAQTPRGLEGAAFDGDDLDELMAGLNGEQGGGGAGGGDPDDVPEPPAEPQSVPGDLYLLGPHRLLCGDSTVVTDVERLMNGDLADLVFTDPPYGVGYTGGAKPREALQGDQLGSTIYADALPMLRVAAADHAALYLWYADAHAAAAAAAAAAAGYVISAQVIWVKNNAQFVTSAHYKGKHEPCYYAHRKGKSAAWYGPNNEVTVWEANRANKNEWHPTQKPTELAERAMRNSSPEGGLVLDLFGGSGSTLIAAHATGRRACLMEIEPAYADVICRRFEKYAGIKPERVLEDGTPEPVSFAEPAP